MKRYQCNDFGSSGCGSSGATGQNCCQSCSCWGWGWPSWPVWPTPPAPNPPFPGVTPFVAGTAYQAGQVVSYQGALYVVNVDLPQGIPGASADFTRIGVPTPTLPTGPVGPTAAEKDAQPLSRNQEKREYLMHF